MERAVVVEGLDKWDLKKKEIDEKPRWVAEGETIEVIYGDFEETKTDREDPQSRKRYQTIDFKIGCYVEGKHVNRLVNQYDFSAIIGAFQTASVKGVKPKTLQWRRPYVNAPRRR